jgi:glycosyltransferase 2 family protein
MKLPYTKNLLKSLIRIGVSGSLIFFIYQRVNVSQILSMLLESNLLYACIALQLFLAAELVSSIRFYYVCKSIPIPIDFYECLRLHFIGLTFNQVLPSSLGGDVVKMGLLVQTAGFAESAQCMVLSRIGGLLILLLNVSLLIPYYYVLTGNSILVVTLALLSLGGIISLILGSLIVHRFMNTIISFPGGDFIVSITLHFRKLMVGNPLFEQIWTSLLVHLGGVGAYYFCGLSVNPNVSIVPFFAFAPLVFLFSLLPISFAGWGVRELTSVWLFSLSGLSSPQTVSMSMLFGIVLLLAGSPGLLFVLFRTKQIHRSNSQDTATPPSRGHSKDLDM